MMCAFLYIFSLLPLANFLSQLSLFDFSIAFALCPNLACLFPTLIEKKAPLLLGSAPICSVHLLLHFSKFVCQVEPALKSLLLSSVAQCISKRKKEGKKKKMGRKNKQKAAKKKQKQQQQQQQQHQQQQQRQQQHQISRTLPRVNERELERPRQPILSRPSVLPLPSPPPLFTSVEEYKEHDTDCLISYEGPNESLLSPYGFDNIGNDSLEDLLAGHMEDLKQWMENPSDIAQQQQQQQHVNDFDSNSRDSIDVTALIRPSIPNIDTEDILKQVQASAEHIMQVRLRLYEYMNPTRFIHVMSSNSNRGGVRIIQYLGSSMDCYERKVGGIDGNTTTHFYDQLFAIWERELIFRLKKKLSQNSD